MEPISAALARRKLFRPWRELNGNEREAVEETFYGDNADNGPVSASDYWWRYDGSWTLTPIKN